MSISQPPASVLAACVARLERVKRRAEATLANVARDAEAAAELAAAWREDKETSS